MTDVKKTSKASKMTDVERPGATAPSPNSKSVIMGHGPMLRDPMMNAEESTPAPAAEPTNDGGTIVNVSRMNGSVLQPIPTQVAEPESAPELAEDAEEPTEAAPTDTPAPADEPAPVAEAEAVTPTPASKPTETSKPKSEETKAPSQTSTGSDAKLGTKDVQTDVEAAAAEEAEAKRQATLQALIESKKYYLPINMLEKQRTKQFVAGGIVLSLLLIVVWMDVALDAGLIQISHLKALTHFFK